MVFLQLLNNLVDLALVVTLLLFFALIFSSFQFDFEIRLFGFIIALTKIDWKNWNVNLINLRNWIYAIFVWLVWIYVWIILFFYFGDRDGHVTNILDVRHVTFILDVRHVTNILFGAHVYNILDGRHSTNILDVSTVTNILFGGHVNNILDGRDFT